MVSKNLKGQFKIQQMAFMLVGIVLFFILVGLFWVVIQKQNLYQKATDLREERAIKLSQFIADSPEFNCPHKPGYCVDTDKVMVLMNRTAYREYWPVSSIKIIEVYPAREGVECNFGNYPNCSTYNVYENEEINSSSSIGSYVSLCRKEKIDGYKQDICRLGKIVVGYEVQYV